MSYKFNEDALLDEFRQYIDSTYKGHYGKGHIQILEVVFDDEDGLGFCRGNAIKYLRRYGKKAGRNRDDLWKALHYTLLAIRVHDTETRNTKGQENANQ